MPLVTVLMPTYKGANYLSETIDSILNQTFKDFEFLIINDCSPDDTDTVIARYNDPRIRYIKNETNLGISGSSNKGFQLAKGKYIVRQDHDDIALPDKLRLQVEYMESHTEVGLCGTGFTCFGNKNKTVIYPETDAEIKALLLFKMPLAHQTSIMRRQLFLDHNLTYDETFASSNDRRLWIAAMDFMQFHNLPQPLLRYRMYKGMTSQTKRDRVLEEGRRLREILYQKLGYQPSAEELEIINNCLMPGRTKIRSRHVIEAIGKILCNLLDANRKSKVFDQTAFENVCGEYWHKRCLNYAFYSRRSAADIYRSSPLAQYRKNIIPANRIAFGLLNGLFCWRR